MSRKIGKALVVGAGISGIRAALDLAETGYGVTLIDRASYIGGMLSQLDRQFPSNRCGMCKMLPKMDRDASSQYCLRKGLAHENIEILTATELVSVDGDAGNFTVSLRRQPQWVDPDLCVGCGLCQEVCPVEIPDEFNAGMEKRKAVYRPVPHAIPSPFTIDIAACNRCGECVAVCPTRAIQLMGRERKEFRILIVDDELIVRESLADLLNEEGFFTETADSGKRALELIRESAYHLMLTDIKMPGMDGVELLKKAKEIRPELSVFMMTAFATVETAVDAMKIGALDYLVKPFDPEHLIPMVVQVHEDVEKAKGLHLEVGAIVVCGGVDYYDPGVGKNTLGFGRLPNVVTSIEFERMLSGSGPFQGKLLRPLDGKPVRSVSWIQCVGSRDIQADADYCSGICCMFAVKEAVMAREACGENLDVSILFMDMRTFGKSHERYRGWAQNEMGVRFLRGRVHSVTQNSKTGDLEFRWMDQEGTIHKETRDLIVLSAGQRPAGGAETLIELLGVSKNPWGFFQTEPFSLTRTSREGVFVGGAFSGLKDIRDSVIQASAAALSASRVIHTAGGGILPEPVSKIEFRDVYREPPQICVGICSCGETIDTFLDREKVSRLLKHDPAVATVLYTDKLCTREGWAAFVEKVSRPGWNRMLICSCLSCVYQPKTTDLSEKTGILPSLVDTVDIRTWMFGSEKNGVVEIGEYIRELMEAGIARLKHLDPVPPKTVSAQRSAVVVGGGVAGMTAALAIADHGYPVDLVEIGDRLGGNLLWLKKNIQGDSTEVLLEQMTGRVMKHPLVNVHLESQVVSSFGMVGNFFTTVEKNDGEVLSISHGAAIIATGGREAVTDAYGHGNCKAIVTQMELEMRIHEKAGDFGKLNSVVMIQCVGSREEPRMYCSRVCCISTLKHALFLKKENPDISVYVLYRDMMAYGFFESYYTQARKAGVIFIQYDPLKKPEVEIRENTLEITVFEPILQQPVLIAADLLVLAPGIVPVFPKELFSAFGMETDADGFFKEAEPKWLPVDALRQGVFACGLANAPGNIEESIASAEAAAMHALKILNQGNIPVSKITADVRHSLCSLCEQCIDACPYGARSLDGDPMKIRIDPILCQGCGACVTACPNGASIIPGLRKSGMLDVIDAMVSFKGELG